MSRVVTQTPICFKLVTYQLEKLDILCSQLGCKRNKLLNFFVLKGIEALSPAKNFILTQIYSNIEF